MQNYNFFISMWNLLARGLNENKTPDSFAALLQKAKEYCDEHPDQPKLITLFAWNEWIEGAYFLPDMKYGFSYVEAV